MCSQHFLDARCVGKFSKSAMLSAMTRGKRKKADVTVPKPYWDINNSSDDELLQEPERLPEPRRRRQIRIEEAYSKVPSFSSATSANGLEPEGALWYKAGKVVMPDADNLHQELMFFFFFVASFWRKKPYMSALFAIAAISADS